MADIFRDLLNTTIACRQHAGPHCPHCNKTKGRKRHTIRKMINSSARQKLKNKLKYETEDIYAGGSELTSV